MHEPLVNSRERRRFDEQLEIVLAELPESIHRLMEEVPLIVEDYPSADVLKEMEIDDPEELCGLYSGVPLTEPESRGFRHLPDHILIYRAGILNSAINDEGRITKTELRKQIRITILHEMGHHHGLNEEELRELGYG